MSQDLETVEVVIISGPRRGEIIHLTAEVVEDVPPEDLQKLNEYLDQLIAAIDWVAAEVRATTEALKGRPEAV